MRHSLGTAVFAGMFGVTLFGIFLTPVFFCVITGLSERPVFFTPRIAGSAPRRAAAQHPLARPAGALVAPAAEGQTAADAGSTHWSHPARQYRHPGGQIVISHFFIDRPIFASVLSIVLVLAGFVAWRHAARGTVS